MQSVMFQPVLAGLFSLVAVASTTPVIDWASHPVSANETLLLLGGPFRNTSEITLITSSSATGVATTTTIVPLQGDEGSIKFVIPANLEDGQWDVVVDGSHPFTINAPEPWWVAGDRSRAATPGGWLRVFGAAMQLKSPELLASEAELEKVETQFAS